MALRRGRGLLPPLLRSRTSAPNPKAKPRCIDTWRRERGPSWASRQLGPTHRRFDGHSSSTPVGARLRNFPREWDNLTTDRYVRSIVRDGYRVEPSTPIPRPHSHEIVSRHRAVKRSASGNNVLAGQGSDRGIRSKIALPRILQSAVLGSQDRRVISSGIRLKSLNQFVHKEKFKMTTPRTVTNAMHKGDWAVSIDLKDEYFHVPIHVRSRRLLRFAIATNDGLRVFEFRALSFGLTSAPRVFTKVILPLGHHAHLHAVCLLQYLDDWLLRNPNKSLLARQTSWLLDIIRRVRFVLNVAKSQLTPTQRLIHIGVEYHLDLGLMFPPMT